MMQYQLHSCSCPSCGGSEYTERIGIRDLRDHRGPDTYYVRCKQCQSLYLNPRPICVSGAAVRDERRNGR